jgi:pullulanase
MSTLYKSTRFLVTSLLLLAFLLPAAPVALAQEIATIHYFRPDGEYEGWGLHAWDGVVTTVDWGAPLEPTGEDDFGIFWEVPIKPDAERLGLIIHKGEEKDPGPDMFLDLAQAREAWIISGDLLLYTEQPDPNARPVGDLGKLRAHWVARDTVAYPADELPEGAIFSLFDASSGGMQLTVEGIMGGGVTSMPLTLDAAGLPEEVTAKFPHLTGYLALRLPEEKLNSVPALLKSQLAVQVTTADGAMLDATGVQLAGVLDELYTYDGPLGVTWENGAPTLRIWAPTAKRVRLLIFDDSAAAEPSETITMKNETGVWTLAGAAEWKDKYYLYEVNVMVPATGTVEKNLVTDPYSLNLSMNSTRSQIVDLADAALKPEGWDELIKPELAAPEDITVWELHMRDFSALDASVPADLRGAYLAFTNPETAGMQHLQALADAGLTHLHLLPTFDIATIDEDKTQWETPDPVALAALPPDSEEQQALVTEMKVTDPFNWGYDPFHFFAPEGSYATNPDGAARILEYRQMVQALNAMGLRVVSDVVFNHTNASGQHEKSVLDRVVPNYYHRLSADGFVETSTCCQNTATEHNMMRKLMLDALKVWATEYKIDAFRFDLMGHHMVDDMLAVREMLDGLTLEKDGVDGASIYVYGEGWDFGEVAGNARGVNATQINLGGTGIGTFNDRLRDAVRGIGPFDNGENLMRQGFISGLSVQPNDYDWGGEENAAARLGLLTDWIKVGLTGSLKEYLLLDHRGYALLGAEIDYNGAPTGYTMDPQENIVYADKHDNQTLFDVVQFAAPADAAIAERAEMAQLGHAIVLLSQGVPFQQAGTEMLRSKSFDRDSYNSGDWFNFLDFTYQDNGFGRGLPIAEKNEDDWPIMQPLLANIDLQPGEELIQATTANFADFLRIRYSSPLFRLQTDNQVLQMLHFHNAGPDAIPGLIVMSLADIGEGEDDVDADHELAVVIFNAQPDAVTFTDEVLAGMGLTLHPVLAARNDGRYADASYDAESGAFTVPARSAAVFMAADVAEDTVQRFADLDLTLKGIRAEQPPLEEINAPAEDDAAERPAPESVSFPGTIGVALGGADWAPDDPAVQAVGEGLGVWSLVAELPAGDYEFKAALNGAWDENYGLDGEAGGANIPLTLAADAEVTLHYDRTTNAVWATVDGQVVTGSEPGDVSDAETAPVAPESVSFPGTIGVALGGADWAPDDPAVQAVGEGLGVWSLVAELPAGDYEFKAALNGAWDENYGLDGEAGGANILLTLVADAEVTFRYDAATHAVWAEVMGEVVAGTAPAE